MGEQVHACEPSARAPYERPRRKRGPDFGGAADKGESETPRSTPARSGGFVGEGPFFGYSSKKVTRLQAEAVAVALGKPEQKLSPGGEFISFDEPKRNGTKEKGSPRQSSHRDT